MIRVTGFVLILFLTDVFALKIGGGCDWGCFRLYDPVCASNGKTYGNKCELYRAICKDTSIKFLHEGACKTVKPICEMACITLYAPVCGSDGKTYGNSCELNVAKCRNPDLEMAHEGACGDGPTLQKIVE